MRSAARPSNVHGALELAGQPHDTAPEPSPGVRARRLPLLGLVWGLGAVVVLALLAAPAEIGVGGIPPAEVEIVDAEHAVVALVLHEAQARTQATLTPADGATATTDPAQSVAQAQAAQREIRRRLATARALSGADATVRRYWASSEHDTHAAELERLRRVAEEISLLTGTHHTLYRGESSVDLSAAGQELASRYLTGLHAEVPTADWGRALLTELDGVNDEAAAEAARAATENWWRDLVTALDPPATEPLRAYLGGLGEDVLTELGQHPQAGPALARLREG